MSEAVVTYPGKDLEAMSFAVNYHRWLLDEFRPYIGKDLVEVGAGTGSFSKMLLDLSPDRLSLVEPSEMFAALRQNIDPLKANTTIKFFHTIFEKAADEITQAGRPDTIIYVNVLEHIEDDVRELELIRETLGEGGKCLIFVPAMPALFSDFDRDLGHFRRYTKPELEAKMASAGFKILRSRYFDLAGAAPWYLKYRVLKSRKLSGGAVSMYDNIVVPVMRRFESVIQPVFGKNILLAAEK